MCTDDELSLVVHQAAAAASSYGGDLDGVRRRWRSRRRSRAAVAAGSAACLTAVAATGVPLLGDRLAGGDGVAPDSAATSASGQPAPAGSSDSSTPAQRLLLDFGGFTMQVGDAPAVGLKETGGVQEVRSDGSLLRHTVPAGWQQSFGLPDGRLVGLQLNDLMPGVIREDGPDVEGLSIKLTVLRQDGGIELAREVRVQGQSLSLIGATETTAYLIRDRDLVAHELATGRERVVVRAVLPSEDAKGGGRLDIAAGLLAMPENAGTDCQVRIINLADGQPRAKLPVSNTCHATLRLSPDGRWLAISNPLASAADSARSKAQITIVDVATGAVRAERALDKFPEQDGFTKLGDMKSMAWVDGDTLRIGTVVLPANANRLYALDEVLRVFELSVQ